MKGNNNFMNKELPLNTSKLDDGRTIKVGGRIEQSSDFSEAVKMQK